MSGASFTGDRTTEQHRLIPGRCKDCLSWSSKGSCSEGEGCFFEHDRVKKGKGKGKKEPEGQFTGAILLKDSEVLVEKRIVHCVTVAKKEIVIEIESVILGISRTAEISRNVNVIRERIVHLFTDKNEIDPAILKKKEKGKQKLSERSKGTIAVVNMASRRSENRPKKAHLVTEGQPRASHTI